MTVGNVSGIGIAVLAVLAYILNGNEDAEVWGALFWFSAIGNFVLALVIADMRSKYGRT